MRKGELKPGQYREMSKKVLLHATSFRGWRWLNDLSGKPNGVQSPRGTMFDYHGLKGGKCLVRKMIDTRMKED